MEKPTRTKRLEDSKLYKIEHFPRFDVVVNLDANEDDINDILQIIRDNPVNEIFQIYKLLSEIEDEYNPSSKIGRFFVKTKSFGQEHIDFIRGRITIDTISPQYRDDFNKKSRYALAGALSEILLSKKVKQIIASDEVQNLASKYGLSSIEFSEPVVAIRVKEGTKYLIYRNIKKHESRAFRNDFGNKKREELADDLRVIFVKNGIKPADLRGDQFVFINKLGKYSAVLIDTEAYIEENPKAEKK